MKSRYAVAAATVLFVVSGCTKSAAPPRSSVSQPAGDLNQVVDGDTSAEDMTAQCRKGQAVVGRPLRVVTTIAPITSVVAQLVAGTGIVVDGIIPESKNSHTYELTASDTAKIAEADVIISNGLGMENGFAEAVKASARAGAVSCELGTAAVQKGDYLYDSTFLKDKGIPNPHAWLNPETMLRYVNSARDAISVMDPASNDKVDANYVKLSFQFLSMDKAMVAAVGTIPVRNKSLYLFHDSLAYFASHFKMQIGMVLQPPTFGDPTPAEVVNAVAALRSEGAVAFFEQSEFPGGYSADIAGGTKLKVVTLSDEDLPGAPGTAAHTAGQLMKDTFIAVVEALGGDASAVAKVDGHTGVKDTANYPQ